MGVPPFSEASVSADFRKMNIATVGKLCGRKFGTYVLFLDKHSIQSQNALKQLNDLCVEH